MTLVDSDTCSGSSISANEPLAGTAPFAVAWIAIEQPGPFGHDALRQSHFPIDVADELINRTAGLDIRPTLIRRVGKHADVHQQGHPRRVFLAGSRPGACTLTSATISDPRELLEIDFNRLADGDVVGAWAKATPSPDPILLVCTHAKRDVCCAIKGRPIAQKLAADPSLADLVWETSHLGGHRFAATAVQLPHGWVHGRLDPVSATLVLADAARKPPTVSMANARGRSSLSAAAQAADIEARRTANITGIDATVINDLGNQTFTVTSSCTTALHVCVETIDLVSERRESCTKPSVLGHVFKTTIL